MMLEGVLRSQIMGDHDFQGKCFEVHWRCSRGYLKAAVKWGDMTWPWLLGREWIGGRQEWKQEDWACGSCSGRKSWWDFVWLQERWQEVSILWRWQCSVFLQQCSQIQGKEFNHRWFLALWSEQPCQWWSHLLKCGQPWVGWDRKYNKITLWK